MVHAAALVIALSSTPYVQCRLSMDDLPFFAVVTPPYNAAVQSGPISVQVRVKARRVAEPWKLVSDVTLISSTGESVKSAQPEIRNGEDADIATFFFSSLHGGRTYHMQLHWREPQIRGCPPAKWTSLLGQFSTL